MNRTLVVTLFLAAGLTLPASAYYYDMGSWGYWTQNNLPEGALTLTTSLSPVAPDTIAGQRIGYFAFTDVANFGDKGNIYLPTLNGLIPGNTLVISYDIKFDVANSPGAGLCTNFWTIRGVGAGGTGPDGDITAPSLTMGQLGDGLWHHVELTFVLPEGTNWTGSPTGPFQTGLNAFNSIGNAQIRLFRNIGPYNDMAWWATNIRVEDITAGIVYDVNGDFSQLNEDGSLVGWKTGNNACQSIQVTTVVVPEPATMALLTLGGLTLLRRRR